jgi:hypothetical protein
MSIAPEIDTDVDVGPELGMALDIEAAPELEAPECANCGAPLAGPYCAACGQKVAPLNPTLHYFVHELTHELLHLDGKIFRSIRLLLTRPGFLTREIFRGRRAGYISPIRLYLTASILSFAIGAFGGFDSVNFEYTPGPGEVATSVQIEEAAAVESSLGAALNDWLPRAMFVLVPLFAALVMLFRRGSGRTYPLHLYFALHVHAAWFVATAVDSLFEAVPWLRFANPVVDRVTELYMLGYFYIAFWRTYETTIWGTLWRTIAIGLSYGAALIVAVAAIAVPVVAPVMFGGGD